MKTYALINKDGKIENVVMWDGVPYAEELIPAATEDVPAVVDEKTKKVIVNAYTAIISPERTEASGWKPPEGLTAVQIDNAMIGGTYINGVYSPPA